MNDSGHVIVGIDGSKAALYAVEHAAHEAALRGRPLTVLQAREAGRTFSARSMDEAVELAATRHPGLEITPATVRGEAVEVLLEAAGPDDLLVVGSRGMGRFAGLLLGSVSLSVAAAAPGPLLVVRGGVAPGHNGGIVVGVGDKGCEPAVRAAFEEARLRGESLRAVSAWSLADVYYPSPIAPPVAEMLNAAEAGQRAILDGALAEVTPDYPDVDLRADVIRDAPAGALVAASEGASLLVIGGRRSRGRFGTRIGAVGHTVLHHAHAPVMLIPV